MKYLSFFMLTILLPALITQENNMSYNVEKQIQVEKDFRNNVQLMKKLNELPKESHDKFIRTISIFYALNNRDRKETIKACFDCMEKKKQINATEKKMLQNLSTKRKFKKKYLNRVRSYKRYSSEIAEELLTTHLHFIKEHFGEDKDNEESVSIQSNSGQEFWSNAGRTVGYILGAMGCGPACAQVGGALGEGAITVSGDTSGDSAGGTDTEADIDEGGDKDNDTDGVVARPDGSDCQGFPFNY